MVSSSEVLRPETRAFMLTKRNAYAIIRVSQLAKRNMTLTRRDSDIRSKEQRLVPEISRTSYQNAYK